jgi:hypothetical protein
MRALIMSAAVLLLVAALVPLGRWQIRREIRRQEARQRLAAHLTVMQRGFEQMAVTIGTALLPATTRAAQAMSRMATAFADLGRAGNPDKDGEK